MQQIKFNKTVLFLFSFLILRAVLIIIIIEKKQIEIILNIAFSFGYNIMIKQLIKKSHE